MAIREITQMPSTATQYSRAVMGSIFGKKGGALPQLELVQRNIRINANNLAAYNRVCSFQPRETLPVTYPFVLAFPLHMELITSAEFPFAAMGMVHIQNNITQHRAINAAELLTIRVKSANLRAHDKGLQFDIVTRVYVGDECVWESTGTMLRRQSSEKKAGAPAKNIEKKSSAAHLSPAATWVLPADTGRRYGEVSGDKNPIHLYAVTAKLFGFPRAIVHGMWTKARCMAELEAHLPSAYTVEVQFKLPVLLPANIGFQSDMQADPQRFTVSDSKTGKPHLAGVIRVK